MSERNKKAPNSGLPLPRRDSPAGLDGKVLAHAREHAPRRTPFFRAPWMTGLATAGVVVIAVLLSDTQAPSPALQREIPADFSPAMQLEQAAPGTSVTDDAAAGQPTARLKATAEPRMSMESDKARSARDAADTDAPLDILPHESRAGAAGVAGFAADAPENDAPSRKREADAELAEEAASQAGLDAEQLEAWLRRCADLQDAGETGKAVICHEELLEACPQCTPPATPAEQP
jgi:hypothetical protein